MNDHEKVQRELDQIMIETGIIEKGQKLWSAKWVERGAIIILSLFATAILTRYWSAFLDGINFPK